MSRSFFAPEVVQTSAMDCGPASLKCLLDGHGLGVSYGRLREACQTSVDGTSIDTMEDIANALGLESEQIVVPVDHILVEEAGALPAIIVVRLPSGLTHFIVVWRRVGPFVQVMDPGTGRRWIRADAFLRDVHRHAMPFDAEHFREWAGSDEFLGPLRRRLSQIGIGSGAAGELISTATSDARWRRLATLDAATRTVTGLVAAGAISPGAEARKLIDSLGADAEGRAAIPRADWTAYREDGAEDAEEIILQGAVMVRALGPNETAHDPAALAELPPDLAASRTEAEQPPVKALWRALREEGVLVPTVWVAAMAVAAAGVTLEALLFRGLLDLRLALSPGLPRLAAALVLVGFLLALVVLERPLESGVLRMGRHLETRLRLAFLDKIPRLGDRYFRSRLGSDMAERSHALASIRNLPQLATEALRAGFGLVFTAVAIAWLVPAVAPIALGGAALTVALPMLMQPLLTEPDLRLRTHGAALSRFYLDALLGLVPIRAHGAQRSVAREHEGLLGEWVRTGLVVQRRAVAVQGLLAAAGVAIAATIVITGLRQGGEAGHVLLLVFWALRLPAEGTRLATAAQQYPAMRNVILRLYEPLGAPEEPLGEFDPSAPRPSGAVSIDMKGVGLEAGGHRILEGIDLHIEPGEHVAVVGVSGAGKSSLAGLLLGWSPPTAGEVRVDGRPLDAGHLASLRQQIAWIDPDVALWKRSLDANVRYGNEDEAARTVAALEVSELRAVVERLPDGMQTSLGEGGKLVSGGEGQRVRTARALMRSRARLAILDEAFRGLDRSQRQRLTERLREHWRDATMLYITHDVADTTGFDRVLVVDGGRIIEDASPAKLLDDDSKYRALVEAERSARASLWTAAKWTRARVEGGRVRMVDQEGSP